MNEAKDLDSKNVSDYQSSTPVNRARKHQQRRKIEFLVYRPKCNFLSDERCEIVCEMSDFQLFHS